jgi:hypothetical protein
MASDSLNSIPRHELLAVALELGIPDPQQLDDSALSEAVQNASAGAAPPQIPEKLSWLGVAKFLVANVVEQGLNLPEAAKVLRRISDRPPPKERPPLPTVTLAQIYLAQGHKARARNTLELVVQRQPDNTKARRLLDELAADPSLDASSAGQGTPAAAASEIRPPAPPTNEASEGASPSSAPIAAASPKDAPLPAPSKASTPAAPHSSLPVGEWDSPEDQLVLLKHAPGDERYHMCWELSPTSSAMAKRGEVAALVKIFRPCINGCRTIEQRFPVSNPNGTRALAFEPGDVVRAALIVTREPGCVLAVASEHQICESGSPRPLWQPRAGQDDSGPAARAAQQLAPSFSRNRPLAINEAGG